MEVSGKIKVLKETQTVGASDFKKREVVITTNEQYPQHLLVEFIQDKCDLLNAFNVEDEVTIAVNLRGREWQAPTGEVKYFNSIQGWKIANQSKTSGVETPFGTAVTPPFPEKKDKEEDFPF